MCRDGSSAVPPITAASATTITPTPMDASAAPISCANSAPDSPVSPLASASPPTTIRSHRTPLARAIRALAPAARIASPTPVSRNQSSSTVTTATSSAKQISGANNGRTPKCSNGVKTVSSPSNGVFGRPITRRLTEYSAIDVNIPARICSTRKRWFRNAVTDPAAAPAAAAAAVAVQQSTPCVISAAATAAPSGNDPSTVKSGKSSTRNVRNAPSATKANASPVSPAPTSA